jgi:hypothetical protein
MLFKILPAVVLLSSAFAAPLAEPELVSRATQCGQYQSQSSGPYTLFTNGWGWSSGSGSQCSQIDSLTGSSLAWSTTWSWANTPNQVKSYTNVEIPFTKKTIGSYTSMPTTWKWAYTGTNLRVNGMSPCFTLVHHGNKLTQTASCLRHFPGLICQWRPALRSHGMARCLRRRVSTIRERLSLHTYRDGYNRRHRFRSGLWLERIGQGLQLRCTRRSGHELLRRLCECSASVETQLGRSLTYRTEPLLQVSFGELREQWFRAWPVPAGLPGWYGGVYGQQCEADDVGVHYCHQLSLK